MLAAPAALGHCWQLRSCWPHSQPYSGVAVSPASSWGFLAAAPAAPNSSWAPAVNGCKHGGRPQGGVCSACKAGLFWGVWTCLFAGVQGTCVQNFCSGAHISHHLASAPLWGRKSHINRGHMQHPRHRALARQVCGRFDNTPVLGSASRAAVHRPCASCKQPWQVRQEGNHANRAHVLGFVADSATPSVSVSL